MTRELSAAIFGVVTIPYVAFIYRKTLLHDLFTAVDSDGDGSVSKADVEAVVTGKGGTAESADALYAKLDPKNTGSVSEEQFTARFKSSKNKKSLAAFNIVAKLVKPSEQLITDLFGKLDSGGDGSISKSELDAVILGAGGTQKQADALFTKLDPNHTGSVSASDLSENLKGDKKKFIVSVTA